jgi:hypothetical protein
VLHANVILFAQQFPKGQDNAFLAGQLVGQIIQGIIGLGMLVFLVFYLLAMQNALNQVSPRNRDMEPGMVFLGLIPCFNLVWLFFIVSRVASSLEKEYDSRGLSGDGDFGKGVGITGCILNCVCCSFPGWLICGIIHMNKIKGYVARLEKGSRRKSRDEDEEEDEDDRPRRKRRPRDEDEE